MSKPSEPRQKTHFLAWLRTEKGGWVLFYIATGLVMLSGALGLSAYLLHAFYTLLALGLVLTLVAALWIILHHEPEETGDKSS